MNRDIHANFKEKGFSINVDNSRFKFFAFEVCPVLLDRVEEQLNGCCIRLLSCK
ncbi:hypothetical protein MKX01_030586, partial [Papaver californicum]